MPTTTMATHRNARNQERNIPAQRSAIPFGVAKCHFNLGLDNHANCVNPQKYIFCTSISRMTQTENDVRNHTFAQSIVNELLRSASSLPRVTQQLRQRNRY